jgi:CO dehydrogenase/acetyl-CoA synthase epsilon subunit
LKAERKLKVIEKDIQAVVTANKTEKVIKKEVYSHPNIS